MLPVIYNAKPYALPFPAMLSLLVSRKISANFLLLCMCLYILVLAKNARKTDKSKFFVAIFFAPLRWLAKTIFVIVFVFCRFLLLAPLHFYTHKLISPFILIQNTFHQLGEYNIAKHNHTHCFEICCLAVFFT